jgi:hypothetical protein
MKFSLRRRFRLFPRNFKVLFSKQTRWRVNYLILFSLAFRLGHARCQKALSLRLDCELMDGIQTKSVVWSVMLRHRTEWIWMGRTIRGVLV